MPKKWKLLRVDIELCTVILSPVKNVKRVVVIARLVIEIVATTNEEASIHVSTL